MRSPRQPRQLVQMSGYEVCQGQEAVRPEQARFGHYQQVCNPVQHQSARLHLNESVKLGSKVVMHLLEGRAPVADGVGESKHQERGWW